MQKEIFPSHKLQDHAYEQKILLYPFARQREIARINWVMQVCLTEKECQESLIQGTIHIQQNSSKVHKYL